MSRNLVSVIIPTYNRAAVVSSAIDSVLNQTHENVELIVVDDGSTDHTIDVISVYAGKVKYIKKENGGVGDARNVGLDHATGDYIAYLDSDDVWEPNKLEVYLEKAKIIDKPFLMFSDLMRIKNSGVGKRHSEYYNIIDEYFKGNSLILNDSYTILKLIYEPYSFYPSTFMLPKKVHEKIKWQTKPRINEDLFFVLEASRFCDFIYIPEPLTLYYYSNDRLSNSVSSSIGWSSLAYEIISNFQKVYKLTSVEKKATDSRLANLGLTLLNYSLRNHNLRDSIFYASRLATNQYAYKLTLKKLVTKLK